MKIIYFIVLLWLSSIVTCLKGPKIDSNLVANPVTGPAAAGRELI